MDAETIIAISRKVIERLEGYKRQLNDDIANGRSQNDALLARFSECSAILSMLNGFLNDCN